MGIFKWKRLVPVILVGLCCGSGVLGFADDDGKEKPPARPVATKIEAPAPLAERERRLLDRVEQLEKRVAELEGKARPAASSAVEAAAPQPSAVVPATAQPGAAVAPAASEAANAVPSAAVGSGPNAEEKASTKPAKAEPFAFADFTWLNGNPRTKKVPLDTPFFTPEIRADVDYIYDFHHPKDDTIGGSSEVFRANEVQVTQMGIGGDFHY